MSDVLTLPTKPRDTLNRPLHDLRISVMDRCNFRCPYCMPKSQFHEHFKFLKPSERLSFEEIVRLTQLFVELGVKKVRLTGGEPLLRPNLAELIGELTTLDGVEDVALTTNGVLLSKHAAELKAAGLQRVTVSLDTLDPDIFAQMSGGFRGVDQVLEGIQAGLNAGLTPIKLNTVIQRGVNDHTAIDLVERFRGTNVIVRFIEYMDVGNRNLWSLERVVPSRDLLARINERWPARAAHENYHGEVAERYVFEDGQGEIGFISSVSEPFCGSCTRARLSSEGVFYTCLFATEGTDLRAPMRDGASDDEMRNIIRGIWTARGDRYSELRAGLRANEKPLKKIEMHYIGG
ncbi:MAG: GTP 3',8-cyclase MoaA [Candidatus Obscuribacterales bacterium]|nr:GTP 3',8-cyclase MoaA [Steroidobacteraceae bacterium]